MRPTRHPSVFALLGIGLALVAIVIAGCSKDSPTEPQGGAPAQQFSNMSFDQLGAAIVPGGSSVINVKPLAGSLENFTVKSSNDAVATVSGGVTPSPVAGASGSNEGTITVTGVGNGSATITVTTESGDTRAFPVSVYDPMVLDTGEMLIKFTNEFGGRFNDSGSGADDDGDFYHPIAPAGYYPLGSIGFHGYQDPNNLNAAAIVVKDKGTNPSNPPIKQPVGYTHIWNNGFVNAFVPLWSPDGCCAGSFWRPDPPPGYVAMGIVVHVWQTGGASTDPAADPANQPPPLDAVVCVRKDLTTTAKIGSYVWRDAGNGLSDRNFRADQLIIPDDYTDYEFMHVAPGTFAGRAAQDANTISNLEANVLKIPTQVVLDADYYSTRWRPELTSLGDPGDSSQPIKTRAILVPFTAFVDASKDINWKVSNSPFYLLERDYYWDYECFASGFNDCKLDYTSGTGKTITNTRWEQESVTASKELGFALKGVSGKVKSTVTKTLGFAESIGVNAFTEKTVSSSVPAPGEGAILVTWKAANRFSLYRHDGGTLQPVVTPWLVYEDRFHSSRFP